MSERVAAHSIETAEWRTGPPTEPPCSTATETRNLQQPSETPYFTDRTLAFLTEAEGSRDRRNFCTLQGIWTPALAEFLKRRMLREILPEYAHPPVKLPPAHRVHRVRLEEEFERRLPTNRIPGPLRPTR